MPKVEIREATLEDIPYIAANMNEADVLECEAGGFTPFEALFQSFENAVRAWTAFIDDEMICMFGVGATNILLGEGTPWLLGTPGIKKNAKVFMMHCQPCIDYMLCLFPHLTGYVDVRHTVAIKWLKNLGFEFDYKEFPLGPKQMPFYKFEMQRN